MEGKNKYSVSIKFMDNETGKTADVFMDSDDPKKLGGSADKFIQASALMVNLSPEELKEIQEMIAKHLKDK